MSHRKPVEIKGPDEGNRKGRGKTRQAHTHSSNLQSISNTFWHLKPTLEEIYSIGLCILQIHLHQSWLRWLWVLSVPHSIALNRVNTIIFMCKMWQMAAGNFNCCGNTCRIFFVASLFFRFGHWVLCHKVCYAKMSSYHTQTKQQQQHQHLKNTNTNDFQFFFCLFVLVLNISHIFAFFPPRLLLTRCATQPEKNIFK